MHPMTLYESGNSSGKVSLEALCKGDIQNQLLGDVDLKDLIDYVLRGGWPANIGVPLEMAMLVPSEYIRQIINDDLYRMDRIKRDAAKMMLLLRSLARNESTTATKKLLQSDIKGVDEY